MSIAGISLDDRLTLLDKTQTFTSLDDGVLTDIAQRFDEVFFKPGETVVSEGEVADRIYIIASGRAEVSVGRQEGKTVLAILGAGELFGEMALFEQDRKRQATVQAVTHLQVLSLDGAALHELLSTQRQLPVLLRQIAETRQRLTFLKRFSPFKTLPPERLKTLLTKLEKREVGAAATLICQGEKGQECYLIISGTVEVLSSDENQAMSKIATLYPGCIVGEAALLIDEPRNSTVCTLEPCELLVIQLCDLLELMREDSQLGTSLMTVLQQRSRPRRAEDVIVQPQTTSEGDAIWVLKNPGTGTYVRLTAEGWFIWQRLDGRHTLKSLCLEFMDRWKVLAPEKITAIITELAKTGFIKGRGLSAQALSATRNISKWQRLRNAAAHLMEYNLEWKNPDPFFSHLYRSMGRFIFTKPVQLIFGLLSLSGLILFFSLGGQVAAVLHDPSQSWPLLLFLIVATLPVGMLHELGHALTTKHYNKEVRGAGIGWYWFDPIAFIDTTDMWTAEKWPRVMVSIAGPYTDIVLAGIASWLAWVTPSLFVSAALWQFALISYMSVLINLDPMLEYDGYFILSDMLGRPNLRRRSMEWLGSYLRGDVNRHQEMRDHKFELFYGTSSVIYIFVMAYVSVVSYRIVLESHLKTILPDTVAWGLPFLLAGILVFSAFSRLLDEMNLFNRSLN